MNSLYAIPFGYTFDIDGNNITEYIFFRNLEKANKKRNEIIEKTGIIPTVMKVDDLFYEVYTDTLGCSVDIIKQKGKP